MLKIVGRIFGNKKVVDAGISGIDKAFFTNQEKAGHFLKLLKAYEPFKLAQRFLALIVGIPYVLVWLLAAILLAVGDPFQTAKTLASWNNDTLGTPSRLFWLFTLVVVLSREL